MKITNAEISGSENNFCVCCEYAGARYHVWLKDDCTPKDNTLYKNSLLRRGEVGHFETRHLKQNTGTGFEIVPQMLAAIPGLMPAFRQKLADNEAARLAENAKNVSDARIRDAAPELLAALQEAQASLLHNGIDTGPLPGISQRIRYAIAKARGEV